MLTSFTDSYAASNNQQSVPLVIGAASGKLHKPEKITESRKKRASLFLLKSFTASYAASDKQQSVQLVIGVASGKLHLPEIK